MLKNGTVNHKRLQVMHNINNSEHKAGINPAFFIFLCNLFKLDVRTTLIRYLNRKIT